MGETEKVIAVHSLDIEHAIQDRVIAVLESSAAIFELPRAAAPEDFAALMRVDARVGSRRANIKPGLRVATPGARRLAEGCQ